MRHPRLAVVGLVVAAVGTLACGSPGDTRPFTVIVPTAPSGPAAAVRLTVANGWTGAPVPQARVSMDAAAAVTDQAGQFEVPTGATTCVRATVTATGYLERRMICLPTAAPRTPVVTLWPVENDAERSALQVFAFRGRGETLAQPFELILEIQRDQAELETVTESWRRAGNTLQAAARGAAGVHLQPLVDDGAVVSPWSSPADCASGVFPFEWPADVSGFCLGKTVGYFAHMLLVAPSRIADERVALRAMLYELGLRPHALPGLMNATQPADALSDFERRTLHMMSLRVRRYPQGVSWPDSEF